jgi:hypothetical protein
VRCALNGAIGAASDTDWLANEQFPEAPGNRDYRVCSPDGKVHIPPITSNEFIDYRITNDGGCEELVLVDVGDTIVEVRGYAQQAFGYGDSGVRGLTVVLATMTTARAAAA